MDREIVEEILLDRLEAADYGEVQALREFARSSGLMNRRITEVRRSHGWSRRRALLALGRMQVSEGIPALADRKFDFTDYSFNDIVKSTEARALKIIEESGGKISENKVQVKLQTPKSPKLEQWSPGIPERRVKATDDCWAFDTSWQTDKEARVSRAAGSESTLTFDGVAVAVMGDLSQDGGKADVYLDGKKVGTADAYIVERTHDNVLWNTYGLKPGRHTVRFVTTGVADPRSAGKRVTISGAVVYRKAA